jgi:hypothetical protein
LSIQNETLLKFFSLWLDLRHVNGQLEDYSICARAGTSIKFYTSAYDKATTETAQRMFSLLAEQEKGHEARLRAQPHDIKAEIEIEKMTKKQDAKE